MNASKRPIKIALFFYTILLSGMESEKSVPSLIEYAAEAYVSSFGLSGMKKKGFSSLSFVAQDYLVRAALLAGCSECFSAKIPTNQGFEKSDKRHSVSDGFIATISRKKIVVHDACTQETVATCYSRKGATSFLAAEWLSDDALIVLDRSGTLFKLAIGSVSGLQQISYPPYGFVVPSNSFLIVPQGVLVPYFCDFKQLTQKRGIFLLPLNSSDLISQVICEDSESLSHNIPIAAGAISKRIMIAVGRHIRCYNDLVKNPKDFFTIALSSAVPQHLLFSPDEHLCAVVISKGMNSLIEFYRVDADEKKPLCSWKMVGNVSQAAWPSYHHGLELHMSNKELVVLQVDVF